MVTLDEAFADLSVSLSEVNVTHLAGKPARAFKRQRLLIVYQLAVALMSLVKREQQATFWQSILVRV